MGLKLTHVGKRGHSVQLGIKLGRVSTELQMVLRWRHNERDGVLNHQPHDCLLNRLLRCRSKETSKLRVTGLCAGKSPVTGEFPAQRASNAENVSIWWRHHDLHPTEANWYGNNNLVKLTGTQIGKDYIMLRKLMNNYEVTRRSLLVGPALAGIYAEALQLLTEWV